MTTLIRRISTFPERLGRIGKWLVCIGFLGASQLGLAQEILGALKQQNCMLCHGWERKLVGPAFVDVRARYGAVDVSRLATNLIVGRGSGVWGKVSEVPHPNLTQVEAERLIAGILGVSPGAALQATLPDDPPVLGMGS
jgi:cytochrome c